MAQLGNVQPNKHHMGWIEDEKHVLLECPRYAGIPRKFSQVLTECGAGMQAVMQYQHQEVVAALVHAIVSLHDKPLDTPIEPDLLVLYYDSEDLKAEAETANAMISALLAADV